MSPRPLAALAVLGLVAATACACGGGSGTDADASSTPAFVSSTPAPFGPTVPASTGATAGASATDTAVSPAAAALTAKVAPAPTGYTASTDDTDPHGPVSPAGYDQIAGSGASARFHFVTGVAKTYLGNAQLPNELVYQLLEFATAADATTALKAATALNPATARTLTTGTDSAIPGSITLSPNTATTDGSLNDYSLAATRGPVIMFVDVFAPALNPAIDSAIKGYAATQYARLG